jgi:hypothetical protein
MNHEQRLQELRSIKETLEDELMKRPGVVGVDIGFKQVGGRATDELAIRVLVQEKRDVASDQNIPPTIRDVKTDVIQVGRLVALQDTNRYDPIVGGCSIGTCGGAPGVGTLGVIVRDNASGQPMVLSNWHVLVGGTTQAVIVTQPGPGDNGGCPGDGIGTVARSAINEFVDCAVASLSPGVRGLQQSIAGIGSVTGPGGTSIGDRVKKRGRTTGVTWGDVDSVDLTCAVEVAGVTRSFKRQIGVWRAAGGNDVFIRPGDSGSALVVAYYNTLVGLMFAGSTGNPFLPDGAFGIANGISWVFDALNVSLWRPPKSKEKDKDKDKDKDKEAMKEKDKDVMKEKDNDQDIARFANYLSSLNTLTRGGAVPHSASERDLLARQSERLSGPLEERLAHLEAAVGSLYHFISRSDRPVVGTPAERQNERPAKEQSDESLSGSKSQAPHKR